MQINCVQWQFIWLAPLRWKNLLSHSFVNPFQNFSKTSLFLFKITCSFWLCWVFVAAWGLSPAVESGDYSSCCGRPSRSSGFLCGAWALGEAGFSSCGWWVQQLWHLGLVALVWDLSSQIRGGACVPCIGRWVLNHWTTREVPVSAFDSSFVTS